MPASTSGAAPSKAVARQVQAMHAVQSEDALRLVNRMVDRCFDGCIDSFAVTKSLRSEEEQCLGVCVQKYLLLSSRVGTEFTRVLNDTTR